MASIKLNFAYNVLLNLSRVIFPLITAPYISRVFEPDGIGLFNFANTYTGYFALFAVLLVVKKGHIEESRYLCVKKEQRCTAVKSWRSSTSITRPNGCREGCQSRHTVHGTTFRTRYLTDGSGTYTGEWFRWRLQGYRKERRMKGRNRLSRGGRIRAERKSASGSISSRVQG